MITPSRSKITPRNIPVLRAEFCGLVTAPLVRATAARSPARRIAPPGNARACQYPTRTRKADKRPSLLPVGGADGSRYRQDDAAAPGLGLAGWQSSHPKIPDCSGGAPASLQIRG